MSYDSCLRESSAPSPKCTNRFGSFTEGRSYGHFRFVSLSAISPACLSLGLASPSPIFFFILLLVLLVDVECLMSHHKSGGTCAGMPGCCLTHVETASWGRPVHKGTHWLKRLSCPSLHGVIEVSAENCRGYTTIENT